MQSVWTFLIALALTLGQPAAPPEMVSAPATRLASAWTLAQPTEPTASATLKIVDPGSSRSVVFSVIYTLKTTWPETATVTTTTTLPAYLIVSSAPGCAVIAPVASAASPQVMTKRVICTVEAQAGEPADVVLRFAVPWDIRGEVMIESTAIGGGRSATAGASFVVPPQTRLALILR